MAQSIDFGPISGFFAQLQNQGNRLRDERLEKIRARNARQAARFRAIGGTIGAVAGGAITGGSPVGAAVGGQIGAGVGGSFAKEDNPPPNQEAALIGSIGQAFAQQQQREDSAAATQQSDDQAAQQRQAELSFDIQRIVDNPQNQRQFAEAPSDQQTERETTTTFEVEGGQTVNSEQAAAIREQDGDDAVETDGEDLFARESGTYTITGTQPVESPSVRQFTGDDASPAARQIRMAQRLSQIQDPGTRQQFRRLLEQGRQGQPGFTLGQGQTRFDASGAEVARGQTSSGKSQPGDARERIITGYMANFKTTSGSPISRATAIKLADGIIKIKTTEQGAVFLMDAAAGTAQEVTPTGAGQRQRGAQSGGASGGGGSTSTGAGAGASLAILADPSTDVPQRTLRQGAGNVAGVRGAWEEFLAKTAGQIPGFEIDEEVVGARSFARQAGRKLVRALAANPRFPVKEQELIAKSVEILPQIMDSEKAYLARLDVLDEMLASSIKGQEGVSTNMRLSPKQRNDAKASIEHMRNFRKIIGEKSEAPAPVPEPGTAVAAPLKQESLVELFAKDKSRMSETELRKHNDQLELLLNAQP